MSLGLSDDRNRRRRRKLVFGALLRWGLVLAVGLGVGLWANQTGKEFAQKRATELQGQLTTEAEQTDKLRLEIEGLQAALRTERDKVAKWQSQYEADVPGDREMPIVAAVRKRLDEGISPERLQTVVEIARDDVTCEAIGDTKRFFINNEISRGANDSVTFAGGTITITGDGTAARNDNDQPEAWFDKDQPVTLTFLHPGSGGAKVSGLLPLQQSVAIGDIEYRFTAVAGARSFVQITGQRCPLS